MAKPYPKYSLDQYECIRASLPKIRKDIHKILREEGKISVISKEREVWIQSCGDIELKPCCGESDDIRNSHYYIWLPDDTFISEPNGRVSRRKTDNGFKVVVLEPREPIHRMNMFTHHVDPVFIARVIVDMKSDIEFGNPDSKPEFIFTINVITFNGIKKGNNQRLTVDLVDGTFYYKGKKVIANNNEEVVAEVSAKIAALSQ